MRALTASIRIYSRLVKASLSRKAMFERYSETARRAIHSSRYMAGCVGSPKIETEHLLLGLLRADKVLARRFLGSSWAAYGVWRKIEKSKPVRDKTPGGRELPLSSESKHVLSMFARSTCYSASFGKRIASPNRYWTNSACVSNRLAKICSASHMTIRPPRNLSENPARCRMMSSNCKRGLGQS